MGSYERKINQTDLKIQTSFLQLLQDYNLNEVSINDICNQASINRSTFYRHFEDKYELLEIIEADLISQLSSISKSKIESSTSFSELANNLENYVDILLDVIQDNYEKLAILLSKKGDPNFHSILKQLLQSRMEESWNSVDRQIKPNTNGIDTKLAIDFIVASDMAIIEYTINNPEIEHNQIKRTFSQLLIKGPLSTLYDSVNKGEKRWV